MKKYLQQIIVGLVLVVASVGAVSAMMSFDITTLLSGFIRRYNIDDGPVAHNMHNFYYGYGWSGLNQEWGYGYGYSDLGGNESTITNYAPYGFEGAEGPATIDSVVTDKTTATITYSTNYLAKITGAYGLTDPVSEYNYIGLASGGLNGESDFTSGERVWSITDLTCDTTYYYVIASKDAGDNNWPVFDSFITDSCGSGTQVVGGSIGKAGTTQGSNPRGFRLPPITLLLGSVGQDVQDLQILLNYFGSILAPSGAGSPNEETEKFGRRTYNALKNFQKVHGLEKVDGIYGVKTRGMFESLLN